MPPPHGSPSRSTASRSRRPASRSPSRAGAPPRRAMGDPAVALIGGPVAPRWEQSPPSWLRTATESYGPLAAPVALLDYGASVVDLGPRTVLGPRSTTDAP